MVKPDQSNKTAPVSETNTPAALPSESEAPTGPSDDTLEIEPPHELVIFDRDYREPEPWEEIRPSRDTTELTSRLRFRDQLDHFGDAGLFSFTAGVLGAAVFMAVALGPGWVGFLAAYLPASILASWAVASHG